MYRKFLLASVGALALTGSAALAADLPSRAPPPVYLPPPPIFTWTGIYVGGQIGYAWASGNNDFTGFDPFFGPGGTFISSMNTASFFSSSRSYAGLGTRASVFGPATAT